jgi:4-amino-4-deoxy-L-arabinose transferase-like glycosyltransferase
MNENPLHPSKETNSKAQGKTEDPSILDYLIQSLRGFPHSLRSATTKSSPSESSLPKDEARPVESPESKISAQASTEPDTAVQPNSNRRTLLMIKLPFGTFVTFGVETNPAPAAAAAAAEQPKRPQRPFINIKAKREFSTLTIVCSVLFSLTGLWLLFQTIPGHLRWMGWVLLINSVLIFIFATRVGKDEKDSLWDHLTGGRLELGVKGWQKICLAGSVCLALIAAATAGFQSLMDHPYLSVITWLGAIVLAILGGWKNTASQRGFDRGDAFLFLVFTIFAFALRVANVANNPNVLTGDEAGSGLGAVLFVEGKMNNIFTIGWYSFPSFHNFLQSLSIRLFGQTTLALRLLSVLAGALTIGAVYIFGSRLFNRWTGVYAALFLSAFHYHNHFSRIGLNNSWDGLFFVIVLGLLWYGWEKEDRLSFLFCGLSLGLAQYFYVTSRVLLLLVPLILLILSLTDRKRADQRLADIFLMGLVCVVTILPLVFFFIMFPLEYYAPIQRATIFGNWMDLRMQQTGWSPLVIILDQIRLGAAGLVSQPLRGPFYEPTTPLLRPISAFLFLAGMLALLVKWKNFRTYILLLWLVVIVLIGGLSENAPSAQRYIAIAPAVALTIGFGLAALGGSLGRIKPRYASWILLALLAILSIFSVEELKFYYSDYSPKAQWGGDNPFVAQHLADYLQTKDNSWQVAFFGSPHMGYYSFPTLPYLAPQIIGIDMNYPWGSPDNPPITSDHMIFVFLPNHQEDLKAVQTAYPNGRLHEEKYNNRLLYWLYEIPSS